MKPIDLNRMSEALPIHAEEGSLRETLAERVLIEALSGTAQGAPEALAVEVLRRLFQRLRLLDESALSQGDWAFVSFPAYLMGRSVVEMLSAEDGAWFEPGYWQNAFYVERQRQLLQDMEDSRVAHSGQNKARPIRFVTVAWGLLRAGDEFLLRHREDKDRDKDWVFPGGRFRLDDAPAELRMKLLRTLYFTDHEAASNFLSTTLLREIREELNLAPDTDFTFEFVETTRPYRKVAGDKNNTSYTEYRMTLYALRLTDDGEAKLFAGTTDQTKFAWFSIDELIHGGRRPDGKTAFIDALREHFGPQDELRQFLTSVPSSVQPYRFGKETDAVDIPASVEAPFRKGKTGKERDVQVDLNAGELALLNVAAAHGRRLKLAARQQHLILLGGGWARLISSEATACAASLVRKLDDAGIPILQLRNGSIRLAIQPEYLHFSEDCFDYSLMSHRLVVTLTLRTDPWASTPSVEHVLGPVDPTITLAIRQISKEGRLWKGDEIFAGVGDFDRALRDKLDGPLSAIGLRKLFRTVQEDYVINVPQRAGP